MESDLWADRWKWYQKIGFAGYTKEVWEGKVPLREKNLPMIDGNYTVHYDSLYGTADLWNNEIYRAEVYPDKGIRVYINNGTGSPVIVLNYKQPEWACSQIYHYNYESTFITGTRMPIRRVIFILKKELPDSHFPPWNLVREKIKQSIFKSEEGWQKAIYWYERMESEAPLEEVLMKDGDYHSNQVNHIQLGRCKARRRKSEV